MQKVISFDKTLDFKTMVGEVTSISLDPKLAFSDDSTISGELVISGKYKLTAASRLEDDFIFHLPVEIVLTESLDEETRNVAIDDFRYEVQEDDSLSCHIDLLVEGVEKIEVDDEEEVTDNRQSEDLLVDSIVPERVSYEEGVFQERETSHEDKVSRKEKESVIDSVVEVTEEKQSVSSVEDDIGSSNQDVGSLFSSFKDSDETFATYSVYIVRQNDTIESIMEKYQVSREDLDNYNDLSNLSIGMKIIIPTQKHE